MRYLLGIDIGTTGVKGVLIDESGVISATATLEYPLYSPRPLWSEQNPDDWWKQTVKCIRDLLEKSSIDGSMIYGVGLSGQMHSLVVLDSDLEVLRPAILWNDQRTGPQCKQITAQIGFEQLLELTANPVLPGFTLPKILWLFENEHDVYMKIAHFLLPKDYIRFRLTGELSTEVSDASGTSLFDVKKRGWSDEIFKILGIPRNWAPQCFESQIVTGNITPQAASITGLSQGTPVVGGAGDQAAQAIGTGLYQEGQACVTIGTSGVVFAPTKKPLIDPMGRLHSFCHAVPGTWHVMGVMLSAGGSLKWFKENMAKGEISGLQKGVDEYEYLMKEGAKSPPGSQGLLFLPYLSGERTPHGDPLAKGAFVGLTLRHKMPHLIRAVIEGVSFGLKDCMELIKEQKIDPDQIIVSGGGSRSALWRQILADIFEKNIATVNLSQGAALGAALLAGVGSGVFADIQKACETTIKIESETLTKQENQRIYQELYFEYGKLYKILKETFHRLSDYSRN